MRSVGDGKSSIEMLMHSHGAARQGRSPAHRFDLQVEVLKAHRVVPIHRPLKLQQKIRSRFCFGGAERPFPAGLQRS